MAAVPTVVVKQRCWRVLAPKWAHDPLSGAGAAHNGGRFNEPGTAALYLSDDLFTAVAEYEQELGLRPGTFCAYAVNVAGVVDLTDPQVRHTCGVSLAHLHCPWKEIALVQKRRPPTWDVATRLMSAGCAGLRAPSIRNASGVNLVLWCWNDSPARQVSVIDPSADLPLRPSI